MHSPLSEISESMATCGHSQRVAQAPRMVVVVLCSTLFALGIGGAKASESLDFNRDIRPILSNGCLNCHGPDPESRKADLRLDQRESSVDDSEVIVPGAPEKSELIARVTTDDPDDRMPPPDHGGKLTDTQIKTLEQWIREGAPYAKHWSYSPVERPPLPPLDDAQLGWRRNAIDHFVARRLKDEGLKPAAEADRYTLIRRASMDLTGLPPTVAEVDAFVADRSPDAYESLVDRLLNDPAYGERWATKWLDLARYADSAGYATDPYRTIWGYRDWVIRAINDNLPYDQFTIEQIAGDLLPDPTQSQLVATAFHRNTLTNSEGGTDDEEFRNAAIVDRVNTTMEVWMGTTMSCAQCHTHKYDPITQEEYFKIFDYFNSTADSDKADEQPLHPVYLEEQRADLLRLAAEVKELESKLTAPSDALFVGQTGWERQFPKKIDWTPVIPERAGSKSGATTSVADDGSILIADPVVEGDVYSVTLKDVPEGTTALRLEVLSADETKQADVAAGIRKSFSANVARATDLRPRAQFVRINLPGVEQRYLHLAEVQVFSGGKNIATGGAARQSSTYYDAVASRAIDGNTDGLYAGKSVSHAALSVNPWWEVDLQNAHPIDRIVIWNRMDSEAIRRIMPYHITLFDQQRKVIWEQRREESPNPNQAIVPKLGNLAIAAAFQSSPTTGTQASLFVLDEALSLEANARLEITLGEERPLRSLKRIRILTSTTPIPDGFGEIPEEIRSIAMRPPAERDAKQAGQLAAYYRTIAPELEETRSRLAMARGQYGAIKPVTQVPIMRELPAAAQRPTYIQIRGSFMNLGGQVSRGTPQALHPFPEGQANNRLGLARWLVARDNPLTARVAVNRYWDELFGHGIVRTVGDFGSQGEQPSHPELLDWLASDFMEGGWDVKGLLKFIVMSAAYRQDATVAPELLERDPENRLLARGPNFRLSAEMLRDQSLAVSGLLARKMYGPPAQPPQPPLGLKAAFGVSTDWTDSTGENRYRRAVYTRWQRSTPYPSLAEFDSPSRVVSTSRRIRTNTPLQVLVTLNDPVYIEAAQALARKISAASGDLSAKVRFGFRQCLSRPPTDEETERLKALFAQCKTVFSESQEDAKTMATDPLGPATEGADLVELAAWTVVGNVLLNTDEFLMKP